MKRIEELIKERVLVIDGAMGTMIQSMIVPINAWQGKVGCNEILNVGAPDIIKSIHEKYAEAGADLIKTNTFGALPWVLDEYGIGERAYELAKAGASLVRQVCDSYSTPEKPRFVAGSLGPGTKLPSLGHIHYDEMYEGYKIAAKGLIDGGVDIFLLETFQDPLQIKAALHAVQDASKEAGKDIPVMVSATIELTGTMLIGTDVQTLVTIMEPFDIFSLGFNCGTGPDQIEEHLKRLSEIWDRPISIHSNAGLPENRGGQTFYPMGADEFAQKESRFLDFDGVAIVGGCCGTTPSHIKALSEKVKGKKPKPPKGKQPRALASLYGIQPLKQEPPPFLVGERTNATGSKKFRELLLKEDYDAILSVAQEQVKSGAHALDVSVNFAGRDEIKDMKAVISRFNEKIPVPLMPDSTQPKALEEALKLIGGRPILNSANLEDGEEKFDRVCSLAKRFGAAVVLLTIDERGMAKTQERKVEVAERMYRIATERHGLDPEDLVFDVLTFTVGSGDEEYRDAAVQTIEAIKEIKRRHPQVGFVLGISNVSFGLDSTARKYLNSVFLYHCVKAGLTMAIVNPKHLIPYHRISEEDRKVCENLLFNVWEDGEDPLFRFIQHFSKAKEKDKNTEEDELKNLPVEERIKKLLIDGEKEKLIQAVEEARHSIPPEKIINEILIDGMKVVGDLFGEGKMQLPFVLQSAEAMKAAVDYLNRYLPKKKKNKQTTLVLGTVKGDVHDVGKNLVDIILTNNGFKVVNLGIKVELEQFIRAYKEHNADAIGMSGLLVKSTLEMKNNLEQMKKMGINVPVLLGGAALNKSFVDEYCRPVYDGPVFYCRDAFDGIEAMTRIEKWDGKSSLDTDLGHKDEEKVISEEKEDINIPPITEIKMPDMSVPVPTPPFWGRNVWVYPEMEDKNFYRYIQELAFKWINKGALFKRAWGYTRGGKSREEYERLKKDEILPAFERLKRSLIEKDIFQPKIIYGYWPCRADFPEPEEENRECSLIIFPETEGWKSEKDLNREPLQNIIGTAEVVMNFPRSKKPPFRCIADYFHSDRHDTVAFTVVSAGEKFSEYENQLFKEGKYKEYHLVHGLGIELAEALAEIVHKQIRIELGIAKEEGETLEDINWQIKNYQGARYSPGYPACPDLSLNREIFKLLKPEELGITLTENYLIVPEQSTDAIVVYHPEATYFSV
ncbi:methionine synthase (B12-dependent) [Persephonella hydrogeniphila]|uniref:Methionine synthase n=1 Tax=Persephonella hydrogeniphila TaxID=198703 RepID=A0A285NS18_9AQUI|nr:methionine synthase [Persephonella hydrogeniphila]SNZ11757.1 methionine synthase (B12-dependent) [Persephonella hydrogeniphila]